MTVLVHTEDHEGIHTTYIEGDKLPLGIYSVLIYTDADTVTLNYPDRKVTYCHVDSTEGTAKGPGIQKVDDTNTPAAKRWLERAVVRVCTEICRRGMGSQVIP